MLSKKFLDYELMYENLNKQLITLTKMIDNTHQPELMKEIDKINKELRMLR